jgi:hypothetical protein
LAAQVARLAGVAPDVVHAELIANPEGFAGTVQRALAARVGAVSGARVVIVVDQFEETFLRCAQEQDRQVFIRALCAAAGTGDGEWRDEPPALVVLGMRADLYGCCAGYPELVPALQDGQVVLGPMRSAELRAAIEGPAHTAGLTLEPGLVETLLHELGAGNGSAGTGLRSAAATYDPGALPLLSHALHATWEHRAQRTLTVAGYQATGGIHGAVATTAEATFQGFDPAGQQAARRLLLHMVQLGDGVADTRLRADWTTLIAHSPDPAAASAVFDAFAHARLITVDEDAVEITHEALLRAWPRLRGWIDADRAGLYVHQQLTETAQGWDRDGRPDAALYRDTDLAVAQDWAQEPDHHADLGTQERDFLAASLALRDRQQQVSQRRARRARQLIASLVVLLVLSLTGGGIALYQARSARYQPALIKVLNGHTKPVTSVAFSPDGRALATGSVDHTVRLWNVTDPASSTLLGQPLDDHTSDVDAVAFSGDGHTLASGGVDDTVRLWDVTDPRYPRPLGQPLHDHTNTVRAVVFSPDGRTLASSGVDGIVWLYDVSDPRRPAALAALTAHAHHPVHAVVFSPDGRTLASGSDDHTVRLWNMTDPRHPTQLGQPLTAYSNYVRAVAFSPDGRTLATGSADHTVKLWNVADPAHPMLLGSPLATHGNAVVFSPHGHILATGAGRAVQLWNVTDPAHPTPLGPPLTGHTHTVTSVVFSPDGHTLASGSNDTTVQLWSLP